MGRSPPRRLPIGVVRLAAERATADLLAQELRAEGPDTEDVGDRPRAPALREHGDGDDAADRPAEGVRLADRVHDLAQQVLVGEVLGLLPVAGAGDDLAPKALDLVAGGVAEAPVEGFARVELLAVDEQRARAGQRVAVLVEVAEQSQAAVLQGAGAVLVLAMEAGDVVVDQLRGRRVVADDDEARRCLDARLRPPARTSSRSARSAELFLRPGDRRDERDLAPPVENPVRGLAARVELPVAGRVLVGRVQDRPLEEALAHSVVGRFYAFVRCANGSTMVNPPMRSALIRFFSSQLSPHVQSALQLAHDAHGLGGPSFPAYVVGQPQAELLVQGRVLAGCLLTRCLDQGAVGAQGDVPHVLTRPRCDSYSSRSASTPQTA